MSIRHFDAAAIRILDEVCIVRFRKYGSALT